MDAAAPDTRYIDYTENFEEIRNLLNENADQEWQVVEGVQPENSRMILNCVSTKNRSLSIHFVKKNNCVCLEVVHGPKRIEHSSKDNYMAVREFQVFKEFFENLGSRARHAKTGSTHAFPAPQITYDAQREWTHFVRTRGLTPASVMPGDMNSMRLSKIDNKSRQSDKVPFMV